LKEEIAKDIIELAIQHNAQLNSSLHHVQNNCSKEDFEKYRKAVAPIMGKILLNIINPILKEHPSLSPSEFARSHAPCVGASGDAPASRIREAPP